MEYERNITRYPKKRVEDYFFLVKNMSDDEKIELIAKISHSIVDNKKSKKKLKTKEEILEETYGSFESEKSADEIIEEIYNSRHFLDKDHKL